jgi:hypothetical protein
MKYRTNAFPVTSTVVRAVTAMFAGSKLHAKQIESVAHAILGAMAAPEAGVAALGRSAAAVRCKDAKHGIKQMDRRNRKIDDLDLVREQVAFVVGGRRSIVATMDGVWTARLESSRHQPGDSSWTCNTPALEDCPQRGPLGPDGPSGTGATPRPQDGAARTRQASDYLGRPRFWQRGPIRSHPGLGLRFRDSVSWQHHGEYFVLTHCSVRGANTFACSSPVARISFSFFAPSNASSVVSPSHAPPTRSYEGMPQPRGPMA